MSSFMWTAVVRVCYMLLTVLAFSPATHTVYGLGEGNDHKPSPPLIGTRTVKEVQGSLRDNTSTNGWFNFDNWHGDAPPEGNPSSRQLVSYYSGDSFGERILVLARSSSTSAVGTWSYRLQTKSWSIVQSDDRSFAPHNW